MVAHPTIMRPAIYRVHLFRNECYSVSRGDPDLKVLRELLELARGRVGQIPLWEHSPALGFPHSVIYFLMHAQCEVRALLAPRRSGPEVVGSNPTGPTNDPP